MVEKRQRLLVLKDNARGDNCTDDLAKGAVGHVLGDRSVHGLYDRLDERSQERKLYRQTRVRRATQC